MRALRCYYRENRHEIQRRVRLFRQKKRAIISHVWTKWFRQSEERVIKVRVAKCLCLLSKKFNLREAFTKWIKYANQGFNIEALGERKYQERVKILRILALQKLKRYQEVKYVNRDREQNITAYYHKKLQIRFLTMLNLSTRLLQRRRVNKKRGFEYRMWHLVKRALLSLAYQVQQKKTFRLLTLALHQSIRVQHAPRVFHALQQNRLLSKGEKIKIQFADGFTVERVYQKCFKALYWHMLVAKDLKALNLKATDYHYGNLLQKGLYSLKIYQQKKQLTRGNRAVLHEKIQKMDLMRLLSNVYAALDLNRVQQQERLGYIKLQLMLNQLQRVFNIFRDYKCMKKSLRDRLGKQTGRRVRGNIKGVMMWWMRALNIEMKTKKLQRQRIEAVKMSVISAFQRHKDIQQIIRLNLTKRVVQYLSIGFQALQNYHLRNKKLRMVQSELTVRCLVRTVQKTFMGLRYQSLIQKNLRLVQTKSKNSLTERSFDGWKYQIMLSKTKKQYEAFRTKRDLNFFFDYWRGLQNQKVSQRAYISKLLSKKDNELKGASFTLWKRGVFKQSYIQLLQKYLLAPKQAETAKRCLNQWHRYTQLQQNKDQITTYLSNLHASLSARRCLQGWYVAATQEDNGSKLKMRILTKKLQTVIDRFLIKKALWKIDDSTERQEYIQQNLNEMIERRRYDGIHKYFAEWRHRYAVKQMNHFVKEQSNRKLKQFCFTAMIAFTQIGKLQKQDFAALVDALRSQTSAKIYCLLFNGLAPSDDSLIRPYSLASHYFYRLKESAIQSRIDREKHFKAVQFSKYKLYVKHYYAFMNYAADRLQKNSQRHRACVFWRFRTHMKVMRSFVVNTLKQRKYRNADAFYNAKICSTAFQSLVTYNDTQQSKAHLKTKMMRVLKKKCINIFRGAFATWRVRFQEKAYRRQAEQEFSAFRDQRQLKVIFSYFAAVCEQQRQIKDMTYRAQNYFRIRKHFKTMYTVLNALKEYGQRHKQSKESIVDNELQAMKFYVYSLQSRHLKAWKREISNHKRRNIRSKLYAIFSAWKFYIKERTLLKMYLQESNIMKDPSLMSTLELKENYARVSNPKSIFGESLSSEGLSGTPFRSAVDQNRVFTNLDINQMQSPHFYNRLTFDQEQSAIRMQDDELMQATGQFSSVSSCQTPSLLEGTGTAAASTAKMIMQSSKTNTRYTRL